MHKGKLFWVDLNWGIFSYDEQCYAFFQNLSNFWRINISSSETPYYSIALTVNREEQCSTSQVEISHTDIHAVDDSGKSI